jgi:RNase P/RNase MRP subunit POP5
MEKRCISEKYDKPQECPKENRQISDLCQILSKLAGLWAGRCGAKTFVQSVFMSFFKPNIDWRGRVVRGGVSLVCAALAVWQYVDDHRIAAVLLGGSALFTGFEACRGWCVARACGVKTRI